ncbi:5-oxoprolinase subunit PxpB [Shewanella surugensis]|uniref:5-oxoprolinase subunit PxpB n=1 Tax=Shewanella surugensis TaxID=212020 RepID=A0ABT0LHD1_9GAMM|nr:5-oxoprolinase subunit PxpB [Shewanella surugensis]MCL1127108.1 5-oxoprolinase subunit PxpB [Shewanella surugensis]
MITVQPISEDSIILYFGNEISLQITQTIMRLVEQLTLNSPSHIFSEKIKQNILEVTPSYTSLFIQYRSSQLSGDELSHALQVWTHSSDLTGQQFESKTTHQLPVYYHPEVGPDLHYLTLRHKLSQEEVVQRHQQTDYHVYAIGFAPGFAFLGNVDPHIATPRHDSPRLHIPAGSVGIANQQTAVYPSDSPGGWQIIGNCPLSLFSLEANPMTPFNIGDKVKFNAITRNEFLQLGGIICTHWK